MGYARVYDKLTPKQGDLLAEIADTAKELGGEPMFLAVSEMGGTTHFVASGTEGGRFSIEWSGATAALAVLDELGLVHLESDSSFSLRQGALNYSGWRNKPRWQRWLSVKWDSWEADVRGGIITIVTSVGASLLFTLLVNLLFG